MPCCDVDYIETDSFTITWDRCFHLLKQSKSGLTTIPNNQIKCFLIGNSIVRKEKTLEDDELRQHLKMGYMNTIAMRFEL